MRSLVLLVVVAAICVVLVPVNAGKGKGKGGWFGGKMKKCGDGEINQQEAFKGFKECKEAMKNAKPETTEPPSERRRRSPHEGGGQGGKRKGWGGKRNKCMMVCSWKHTGMLSNDTGSFNEAGAQAYVERVYPEAKRSEIFEAFKSCNTEHGGKFSMDDKCKGYGDFQKCIMDSHKKVCGLGKAKGGESKDPPPPAPEGEPEDE